MRRKLLLWIMSSKLYKWALAHVIPYIRFNVYYNPIRGFRYHSGYKHLQPGDIIVTSDKYKLTSFLIPGEWDHAALCIGKVELGNGYEVAEMTHTDYTKSYFFDICKEATRVAIYRCPAFDKKYVDQLVKRCKQFENAHYDVEFDMGVESLYCSELIYQSDFEKRLKCDLSDLAGLGRPYISPVGLTLANVKKVWDSDEA